MVSLMVHDVEVDLLRALLRHRVRFVVIGGHAVIYHGHLRAAKDLDLFVDRAGDNPSSLVEALHTLGIAGPQLTAVALSKPNKQIHIGGRFNAELLTSVEGLDFVDSYGESVVAQVAELRVPVLSRQHLLQSKRTLGRPKDVEDVAALDQDGDVC